MKNIITFRKVMRENISAPQHIYLGASMAV